MRRNVAAGVGTLLLMVTVLAHPASGADNSRPIAVDDPSPACGAGQWGGSYPIAEDWQDWLSLVGACAPLLNDWDPDGDALTFELVGQPLHGEAVSLPDGFLAYRVAADYSTPPGNTPGGTWESDVITYRVSDGLAYSETAGYRLWIAPVNDPPSFTAGPATITARALGEPVSVQWATGIEAGPPNETGQAVSFHLVGGPGVPSGMFASPPHIDGNGVLTFTPGNEPGTTTYRVEAKDDGGLEDYGLRGRPEFVPPNDTSAPVELRVTIGPPVAIPAVTLSAPDSPTRAASLDYRVTFGEPVSGLAEDDFSTSGTATGCQIGAPVLDGNEYIVTLEACSEGTVVLQLAAHSVTGAAGDPGPAAPASADAVVIDRTAPTMAVPTPPSIDRPQTTGAASTTLILAWPATVDPSGVAAYEVEQSVDHGPWTQLASTTATSLRPQATYGANVRYRVRARDHAGNVSSWISTRPVTPRVRDESDPAVTYRGSWRMVAAPGYLGGSARYATTAGASASLRFTGRAIAWISGKGPTRGAARVYVDGILADVVNLHASSESVRDVVFARSWPSSGTHTIEIIVSGTDGHPRVDLDGWLRLGSLDLRRGR